MLQAHLLDLWLFVRKVAPNAVGILLVLVLSALAFHVSDVWPGCSMLDCFVKSFYIMALESVELPDEWYLEMLIFLVPLLGALFAAEGLVSATTLFLNKSRRQGEWSAVVASTYSGHTVICGMGQLGTSLCNGLVDAGERLVVIDIDEDLPGLVTARGRDIPVIIGDMTLPETLSLANVSRAKCVIVCSGDDLANIEASIAVKELNPVAQVYARVFKKSLADRINEALRHDIVTFSPYATAAETIVSRLGPTERGPGQ